MSTEIDVGTRWAEPESADAPTLSNVYIVYKVRRRDHRVVRNVSFHVWRGESFGLGASGRGKSPIMAAIVRYLAARNSRVSDGKVEIDGREVLSRKGKLRKLRARRVSMVYQEPWRALNPSILVDRQVARVYEIAGVDQKPALARIGHAPQGADLQSGRRRGPLSAPAPGRHAAARRDRDGARVRALAAKPGRAHDRARRDRRGRGAGPHQGLAHEFDTSLLDQTVIPYFINGVSATVSGIQGANPTSISAVYLKDAFKA